jgi:hypothetical protein
MNLTHYIQFYSALAHHGLAMYIGWCELQKRRWIAEHKRQLKNKSKDQ